MFFAVFLLLVGAAVVGVPGLFLWFNPRRHRVLRVLAVLWVVLTLAPFLLLVVLPDFAFAASTARCRGLPVAASNFAAGDWYDLPGDADYGPSPFVTAYFCSAAEAERAGYHRGLGGAH